MTHNAKSMLVVLLACVVVAFPFGCSEKVVNEPTPAFGNANIVINIQRAPEDPEQLVSTYRLTVTAPDMDTVVAILNMVGGQYVVGEVEVPVGDRRRFVLEGLRGLEIPIVLYRGETVANVRPGTILELRIDLKPVAPMARLSPVNVHVPAEGAFTLDLKLYNMPQISEFAVLLDWEELYLRFGTAHPGSRMGDHVIISVWYPMESPTPVLVHVRDTTGASIVDANGNAHLAGLDFQSMVWVGEVPFPALIQPVSAEAVGLEGDTLTQGDFYVDGAHAMITPVADRLVMFPDPVLDSEIRRVNELPTTGNIYLSDVVGMTYLNVGDLGVANLDGVQNLSNLSQLHVSWNPLGNEDLAYVSGLTRLRYLYCEDIALTDISALAGLTGLRSLNISVNFIDDISAVAGMTDMLWFSATTDSLADLSPLANLDQLRYVYVGDNQITDLSPLQNLPNLYRLELHDNLISDVGPLVANEGLADGDVVTLWGNPVAITNDPVQIGYIDSLRTRGVDVVFGI
jgi:hypothetical protein